MRYLAVFFFFVTFISCTSTKKAANREKVSVLGGKGGKGGESLNGTKGEDGKDGKSKPVNIKL